MLFIDGAVIISLDYNSLGKIWNLLGEPNSKLWIVTKYKLSCLEMKDKDWYALTKIERLPWASEKVGG